MMRKNVKGETIEIKFSLNGKKLVRILSGVTTVYDLADEVMIKPAGVGQRYTFTVTPANRTWNFGNGGLAYIKG